jgi:hypothetical protein
MVYYCCINIIHNKGSEKWIDHKLKGFKGIYYLGGVIFGRIIALKNSSVSQKAHAQPDAERTVPQTAQHQRAHRQSCEFWIGWLALPVKTWGFCWKQGVHYHQIMERLWQLAFLREKHAEKMVLIEKKGQG